MWCAGDDGRPLLNFAGSFTQWTSVRKAKDGEITVDVFGFLTCQPNAGVGQVHPKCMPVILRSEHEHDVWLHAPWPEAVDAMPIAGWSAQDRSERDAAGLRLSLVAGMLYRFVLSSIDAGSRSSQQQTKGAAFIFG